MWLVSPIDIPAILILLPSAQIGQMHTSSVSCSGRFMKIDIEGDNECDDALCTEELPRKQSGAFPLNGFSYQRNLKRPDECSDFAKRQCGHLPGEMVRLNNSCRGLYAHLQDVHVPQDLLGPYKQRCRQERTDPTDVSPHPLWKGLYTERPTTPISTISTGSFC